MTSLPISLDGINQALNNLNYKENSKKFKVISAIKACCISEESINNVISIDTDTLIKEIWNLEDTPLKIKIKRRNFSSITSSINADLKKLSTKDGKDNKSKDLINQIKKVLDKISIGILPDGDGTQTIISQPALEHCLNRVLHLIQLDSDVFLKYLNNNDNKIVCHYIGGKIG